MFLTSGWHHSSFVCLWQLNLSSLQQLNSTFLNQFETSQFETSIFDVEVLQQLNLKNHNNAYFFVTFKIKNVDKQGSVLWWLLFGLILSKIEW